MLFLDSVLGNELRDATCRLDHDWRGILDIGITVIEQLSRE